ncbi:B3 domain-containing protein Os01g0723500-like [Silene latifolia]|uniref:B3 domain-containing protein Os01g0723500-like n=1 Tax=Silene latifolia TaxID=37657 RepID=UPI003D77783A
MENPNAAESSHRYVSKEHHPSFFQLYVPKKNSINLRIPPAFIKNFQGKIPLNISLKNMSGLVWPAKLSYIDDHLHITSGWKDFVKEHSLNNGDFVVFHFVPGSTFLVMPFDADGCSKGAPLAKRKRKITDVRNLQFERIIKTSVVKNFVTVSSSVMKQCVVDLPQRVELCFEGGVSTSQWLRKAKDERIVVGYAGMGRFWEMNNVKKGDRLLFQIICGKGRTVKKIVVTRVQESAELGRGYH